jgi:hypothetical protein
MCLGITAAFFDSTSPLSLEWRGRDWVCSASSFAGSSLRLRSVFSSITHSKAPARIDVRKSKLPSEMHGGENAEARILVHSPGQLKIMSVECVIDTSPRCYIPVPPQPKSVTGIQSKIVTHWVVFQTAASKLDRLTSNFGSGSDECALLLTGDEVLKFGALPVIRHVKIFISVYPARDICSQDLPFHAKMAPADPCMERIAVFKIWRRIDLDIWTHGTR